MLLPLTLLLSCLLLASSQASEDPYIEPTHPLIHLEGRWHIPADPESAAADDAAPPMRSRLRAAGVSADWPCSGVRFELDSPADSRNVTVHWAGLRTRLLATVSGQPPVVLSGVASELSPEIPVQHDTLRLPTGRAVVHLRKLTQATPYSMGIGRVLRPSVLQFHGLTLQPGLKLAATGEVQRRIEFIGASDTAGYCVDGTQNTSSIGDTLLGWELSNCDSAYPGVLGRALGADISVQALAGAGLTQNANAARVWEDGKLTMAQLHTRTLQTSPRQWDVASHPSPNLVVVSLGGNDYNHQDGHVPANATFTAAYMRLLEQLFFYSDELVVASVCGMGSPAEAAFDPDNNRCRPCPHVERAVAAFHAKYPMRRVAYLFVPCDGTVVDDHGDIGCDGHKNRLGQGKVAKYLEPRLRQLMSWT